MKPGRFTLLFLGTVAVLVPASRLAAIPGTPQAPPASAVAAPAAPSAPAASTATAADTPTYVGSDVCASCHDQEAQTLAKTPHGKAGFAHLSANGCETCHGPGSAHLANPDDKALQPRIDRLTPPEQSKICVTCHSGSEQFFWRGSRHETRGLSCITCHSVHAFKSERAQLKSPTAMEQCFTCHKDTRAEVWKTSHHPIREGKITCADCHNPHGTQTAKMIRGASVNEQCYTCHAEKRGPFLWEHAPVRESCMNCHTPHGSNHLKLQKVSVPYLCQQCHANTRHPGTLYDGSTLANQSKASNRIFNRACVDCHSAIHGSNNPSSPYLAQ